MGDAVATYLGQQLSQLDIIAKRPRPSEQGRMGTVGRECARLVSICVCLCLCVCGVSVCEKETYTPGVNGFGFLDGRRTQLLGEGTRGGSTASFSNVVRTAQQTTAYHSERQGTYPREHKSTRKQEKDTVSRLLQGIGCMLHAAALKRAYGFLVESPHRMRDS